LVNGRSEGEGEEREEAFQEKKFRSSFPTLDSSHVPSRSEFVKEHLVKQEVFDSPHVDWKKIARFHGHVVLAILREQLGEGLNKAEVWGRWHKCFGQVGRGGRQGRGREEGKKERG
jgi:hypothetical protein